MKGLHFDLSCLNCGGDTNLINAGRVILGRETTVVVQCTRYKCKREYSIHLDMRSTKESVIAPSLELEDVS